MKLTSTATDKDSIVLLKTNLFNDDLAVSNSLRTVFTDEKSILDISEKANSGFTDSDWDQILDTILSSSKVITV